MNDLFRDANRYVVSMVRAAFENRKPDPKPSGITLPMIYSIVKFQCLDVMLYHMAQDLSDGTSQDASVLSKWEKRMRSMIFQGHIQLEELKDLYEAFRQAEIKALPLKGCVMKEMYPSPRWRQMSDMDILIHGEDAGQVQELLKCMGYNSISYGIGKDDVYEKKPWIHLEIHRQLLSDDNANKNKYTDIWNRAVPNVSNPFLFHMTLEDYYLYMIEHFSSHYNFSGSGIRPVMDMYVFLKKKGNDLDMDYVRTKLKEHNLDVFEQKMHTIMRRWFYEDVASIDEDMESILFNTGYFGTKEHQYYQDLMQQRKKHSSFFIAQSSYVMKKLFPSYKYMLHYPEYRALRSFPFLLPFFWLHRIIVFFFNSHGRIKREIGYYKKYKKQDKSC